MICVHSGSESKARTFTVTSTPPNTGIVEQPAATEPTLLFGSFVSSLLRSSFLHQVLRNPQPLPRWGAVQGSGRCGVELRGECDHEPDEAGYHADHPA